MRLRRQAKAQPQPAEPPTPDDAGDETIEAALHDVAHRFLELTDHAENELADPTDPHHATSTPSDNVDPHDTSHHGHPDHDSPAPHHTWAATLDDVAAGLATTPHPEIEPADQATKPQAQPKGEAGAAMPGTIAGTGTGISSGTGTPGDSPGLASEPKGEAGAAMPGTIAGSPGDGLATEPEAQPKGTAQTAGAAQPGGEAGADVPGTSSVAGIVGDGSGFATVADGQGEGEAGDRSARRGPQLRGRRGAGRAGRTGSGPQASRAPGKGGRWRMVRRIVPAALVVAAVAVPGSGMLGGVTALMQGGTPSSDSELALGAGGFLPIQEEASIEQFEDPAQLEAVPVGEEPVSEPVQTVLSSSNVIEQLGASGIPEVALRAYNGAADRLGGDVPACGVRWSLLAAIGRVESNHGRFGGAQLREDGYGTKPIRGIPLDGRPNVALIRDTDGGELDGDTTFDRAVGPMQFIPSTWDSVGVDANADGRRDPNNIFDATQGAAGYLCAGGGDLRTIDGQARAVRRYNNADEYVRVVLRLARMYDTGRVTPLPSLPALPGPPALPQPQPTPERPAPGSPAPGSPTPGRPSGPQTPSAPTPIPPPTTTVPPTTTTTVAPTTTVPPTTTTVPPTPDTTVPPTTTTTVAPAPTTEQPPAAVGWAPAMREVVIGIIEGDEPAPTTPTTVAPAAPACEPPAADPSVGTDDDLDGNVPEPPAECTGDTPAPPAGAGEAVPPADPATDPTP